MNKSQVIVMNIRGKPLVDKKVKYGNCIQCGQFIVKTDNKRRCRHCSSEYIKNKYANKKKWI